MTERRRFFPSTPVQKVPGQKVEVEVQIRPEGKAIEAESKDCVCKGAVATWVYRMPDYRRPYVTTVVDPETTDVSFIEDLYDDSSSTYYSALTRGFTYLGDFFSLPPKLWANNSVMYEHYPNLMVGGVVLDAWELGMETYGEESIEDFFAFIFGDSLCEPHWTFSWNHPRADPAISIHGYRVETRGTLLRVFLDDYVYYNFPHDTVLTARAFCGGKQFRELTYTWRKDATPYP